MTSLEPDLKIVLNRDIIEFATTFRLSQRETDVFLLLLNRISTSAGIAGFLGLSANTVSNHLKSILTKCRCHSKTELLGQFLEFQMERTESIQPFIRRPRVLVIAKALQDANDLATTLQSRGVEAYAAQPSNAESKVLTARIEAVLYLCDADIDSALRFFAEVRERFRVQPNTFPVTTRNLTEIDPQIFRAVTEIIPAHFSADQIAITIVEYGIPDPYVRNRFVRTESNFQTIIDGQTAGVAENIGHGGLFMSFDGGEPSGPANLKQHRPLHVDFTLPDGQSFSIPSRVAWVRRQAKTFLRAGIGIQFLEMPYEIAQRIREFVRRQKKLPKL